MEACYYFGCVEKSGHYLFGPGPREVYRPMPDGWPFGNYGEKLDGRFPPLGPEKMGRATIHVFHGWTVMAMWDRTVDKRGACNSSFVAHGRHSFDEMVALAKEHFPTVWDRINEAAPVVLVEE